VYDLDFCKIGGLLVSEYPMLNEIYLFININAHRNNSKDLYYDSPEAR
jgi:hypothetical protein